MEGIACDIFDRFAGLGIGIGDFEE